MEARFFLFSQEILFLHTVTRVKVLIFDALVSFYSTILFFSLLKNVELEL